MNTLLQILELSTAAIFVTGFFKPLVWLKEWLGWYRHDNRILQHLECSKCMSFWISLAVTQDMMLSILVSVITYILQKFIDYLEY